MNCSKQNLNHLTHRLAPRTLFCPSIFSNTCLKSEFCLTFNLNTSSLYYNCSIKCLKRSQQIGCPQWEQHSPFSVMHNKEREEAKKMQHAVFSLFPIQSILLSFSSEESLHVTTCIIFCLLFQEAVHHNSLLPHLFDIAKFTTVSMAF